MIILDTNLVSEPMRPAADPSVIAWLDGQAVETLYLTAINLSELLVVIEMLPEGRRKNGLGEALSHLVTPLFGPRVLPFDASAATAYARLVSRARAAGHVVSLADAQIAAIAAVHGFQVASRDTAPFVAMGVPVVNPWLAGPSPDPAAGNRPPQ